MESVKLPLRELRARYTKSEMFIMGWRAAEIAENMEKGSKRAQSQMPDRYSNEELALEQRLGGLLGKAVDSSGEVDLSKMTGDEAVGYLSAFGLPIAPGVGRR
jgi:hypothetical protein